MEVTRETKLPSMPPNYVSLAHLKERWLKNQELKKAEIDRQEKAAAAAAAEKEEIPEMQSEKNSAADHRSLKEETEAREDRMRSEKVAEEVPELQTEKTSGVDRWNRGKKAEKRENRKRREKVQKEFRIVQRKPKEMEEGGNRKMSEKVVEEVPKLQNEKTSAVDRGKKMEKKENHKRREKVEKEFRIIQTEMKTSAGCGSLPEEMEEGVYRKRSEKEENQKSKKITGKIKNKKKYKKKKEKAMAEETLGKVVAEEEKVLGGGMSEKETVGMNGKVWVKKKEPVVVVNPTAKIDSKFGDFQAKDRKWGGERGSGREKMNRKKGEARDVRRNILGDLTADNGRRIGDPTAEIEVEISDLSMGKKKKGGGKGRDVKKNAERERTAEIRRRGLGARFKGFGGVNFGQKNKAMDSSLVWVRKEDKSDVCVAGNCSEGVLEKAGEKEKKPGRGRP